MDYCFGDRSTGPALYSAFQRKVGAYRYRGGRQRRERLILTGNWTRPQTMNKVSECREIQGHAGGGLSGREVSRGKGWPLWNKGANTTNWKQDLGSLLLTAKIALMKCFWQIQRFISPDTILLMKRNKKWKLRWSGWGQGWSDSLIGGDGHSL